MIDKSGEVSPSAGETRPGAYDERDLLATLLVFVAKGDGTIAREETDAMIALLSRQFDIRGAEAMERLTAAVMALADDPDIARTLRSLSRFLDPAQKREMIRKMIVVADADGVQDAKELEVIHLAARILNMPESDVAMAFRAGSG